ncbi:hypothetical protein B566_EDAN005036 [Ephemera danica]|nr:hypothetical protein B566_EDAN005036 [Ephemera danica]
MNLLRISKGYATKQGPKNVQDGFFIQALGEKDMVGPPDPVSNMRPILFHVPANETELEKNYRLQCGAVQKWNQEFWMNHNTRFFKEREKFIKEFQSKKATKDTEALTADEISVFYKRFLDDNWIVHAKYNKEWYVKNVGLMLLSLRVKVFKLFRQLTKR